MPLRTHDPSSSTIDVELSAGRLRSFAAVVHLHGEHDMATAPALADALAPISGDVLIDFSDCSFCDSSVVRVLFEAGEARTRVGQRLELLVPPANTAIVRLFEITRLTERVPTHAHLRPHSS